jgi:predicted nucleotidyltransferase
MSVKIDKIKENKTYARVIDYFQSIAGQSENLRCAYVFGSRAQNDSYQNEFSDLDIEIIVNDKSEWVDRLDWLESIGATKIAYLQRPSDGNGMQVRVLFDDMSTVDMVFLDGEEFKKAYASDQFVNGVFGRGVASLFDKDNLLAKFNGLAKTNISVQPNSEELNYEFKDFLYHLIYAQNKVKQGELLVAKDTMDVSIRKSLMKFIRWEEHLRDPNKDLWHRSRHFEKWSSTKNQELIKLSSPLHTREDLERAIQETFSKATELVRDICKQSGIELDYPENIEKYFKTSEVSQKNTMNKGMKR